MRLLISNFLSISVHYGREVALFNIAGTVERWRGNYRRGGGGVMMARISEKQVMVRDT